MDLNFINTKDAIAQIRSFNRFYTNVISVLDESVLNSGCSLAEARILYEIARHQPVNARGIRKYLTIDEGYLSRIISKLISENLIVKTQSNVDKRQFDLLLSDLGWERFGKLNHLADSATLKLVGDIRKKDLETLLTSMNQIQLILQKDLND